MANPLTAVAQFIPMTQSRAERLLRKSLQKRGKKADVMAWLEYPDGDVRLKRANWDSKTSSWELENGMRFFPRGQGGDPKMVKGVPMIQLHTEDAGPISTESALISGAMTEGKVTPLGPDGEPIGPATNGGRQSMSGVAQAQDVMEFDNANAATDGGYTQIEDYRPHYGGVEFTLSDAVKYDPFPVREEDARQAAEWHEMAGRDDRSFLKFVAMGAIGAFLLIAGVLGLIWLMGEISSDEGTGIKLMVHTMGLLVAGPSLRSVIGSVLGDGS